MRVGWLGASLLSLVIFGFSSHPSNFAPLNSNSKISEQPIGKLAGVNTLLRERGFASTEQNGSLTQDGKQVLGRSRKREEIYKKIRALMPLEVQQAIYLNSKPIQLGAMVLESPNEEVLELYLDVVGPIDFSALTEVLHIE